jgi:HEAT repeat protein
MTQFIKRFLRLLNVEHGEERLVALLLLHSFFIGTTVIYFETVAYSMFLTRYDGAASILPIAYISASLITILVGLLYARLERRLSFQRLLTFNLLTVLAALVCFRLLFEVTTHPFPALIAVIGFDVLWVLQSLEFWGLAGRVFNVRQGKRLFGLVGSGEMLAMVVGGALMPLLLRFLPALNLYLLTWLGVICSLLMMRYILRHYVRDSATEPDDTFETITQDDKSLRELIRERYIILIFVVAAITIFTLYFTDNAFYAVSERQYPNADDLAAFMGFFLALSGLAQLFVRAILTGWLLTKFGVIAGLLLLPVLLALTSAAAIGTAALGGSLSLIFWFVILVKLCDRSVRYSLNRAATLVLYQPLSPVERVRVQTANESIVEPIAGISSGLVLLFLNQVLHFEALQLLFIMVLIIIIWIGAVLILSRDYPAALVTALNRRRLGGVTLSLKDNSSMEVLRRTLHSERPGEVIYALNMLENSQHPELDTILRDLIPHPLTEVRRVVLQKIEKRRSIPLQSVLIQRLVDENQPELCGLVLQVLVALGAEEVALPYLEHRNRVIQRGAMIGFLRNPATLTPQHPAIAQLLIYAQSTKAADRAFAAEMLGEMSIQTFDTDAMLTIFLNADSPEVRKAAMSAAGKLKHPALYPRIIHNLETTHDGLSVAIQALTAGGEQVLPLLVETFTKKDQLRHVKIRLLRIMGNIRGDAVLTWLHSQLHYPDEFVRYYVLDALRQCGYHVYNGKHTPIHEQIIMELQQATWSLAAWMEMKHDDRTQLLQRALEQEIHLTQRRILLLLSFIYDAKAILTVKENYTHPIREKRAYALEILDTLITQDYKPALLTLMDTQPPDKQLMSLWLHYPQQKMDIITRLKKILLEETGTSHPWTRACAFYTIAEIGNKEASPDVATALFDTTDVVIRETAMWTLYRLNPVLYNIYNRSLQDELQGSPEGTLRHSTVLAATTIEKEIRGEGKMLLLVEKVLILRTVSIFSDTPEDYLAEIAMVLQEVPVEPGVTFIHKGDPGNCLYIIASGKVRVHDADREFTLLGEREVVGELALLDSEARNADVTAVEKTMLLKLDQDAFYELITSNPEVVRGVLRVLTRRLRAAMIS